MRKLTELFIHPIFSFLTKQFNFTMVGWNMLSMVTFQNALIAKHDGQLSEVGVSAKNDSGKYYLYDVKDILGSFNYTVKLWVDPAGNSHAQLAPVLREQCRITAISLFDVLKSSSYQNQMNATLIYQFARHIRNGAAHNNKFNITSQISSPVQWRDKEVTNSLHGQEVFLSFMSAGDLILLISDISEELKKIDDASK